MTGGTLLCRYCNLRPAGSREHLPGSAALNDGPVTIRFTVADRTTGHAKPAERTEKDGFTVRTICDHCNSRSGGDYGTAFKDFSLQWRAAGIESKDQDRTWISLKDVQPLRILKQLAGMFLAAQASLEPNKWSGVRDFVRQKQRKLRVDDGLRVFLYRNRSPSGRIASFNGLAFLLTRGKVPPLIASEISWPPLGVVFSRNAHPLLDPMREITEWGSCHFRERASYSFSVPNYHVEHHFPFAFGRAADAERWVNRVGAAYLVHEADVENPTTFSALVRPSARGTV